MVPVATPVKGRLQSILQGNELLQRKSLWRSVSAPQQCRSQGLVVRAGVGDVAGLLVFSALPFVAVSAYAESDAGKEVYARLKEQKKQFESEAAQRERATQQARAESMWYGPDRPKYLGPLQINVPAYLDGQLAGDYAYDPIRLGQDADKLDRYVELELLHSRWAMLSALGALIPEALQQTGTAQFLDPVWWRVGAAKLAGEDLNYLGVAGLRVAGGQGVLIIAICQALLMFGPEYARSCGIEALEPLGIYLPGDKNYPGGVLFDPLNLSGDVAAFEDLKIKEIKNGRLAMVAWLGFFAQAALTNKGPWENLQDFLSDPAGQNVSAYFKLK